MDYSIKNRKGKIMKKLQFTLPAVILACIFAGCSTVTSPEGEWFMQDTPEGITATIFLQPDGELAGSTGLNNYFGSYIASEDGNIILDPKGMTRMAGSPQDMEFENEFLEMIRAADSYEIVSGEMLLKDNGTTIAVFKKEN